MIINIDFILNCKVINSTNNRLKFRIKNIEKFKYKFSNCFVEKKKISQFYIIREILLLLSQYSLFMLF